MKNFKEPGFLRENPDLLLIDARYDMNDADYGKKAYAESHLKGAAFLDMDSDLAGPVMEHGGRHPLPDQNLLEEKLRSIGMNGDSRVLIYDDGDYTAAGRLWWMLKYYGLREVYVLHRGFRTLKEEDLSHKTELFSRGNISLKPNKAMRASYEEVLRFSKESDPKGKVLVDSRSDARYKGQIEPIDRLKGHIRNACNVFFKNNFHEDGSVREEKELRENFAGILDIGDVIVHCGSGVTACSNIMVLEELDKPSRLYLGSFSDFVSYLTNTVETTRGN